MQLVKVKKEFKRQIIKSLSKEQKKDQVLVNEEFGNFLDNLHREGRISEQQYMNYTF